MAFMAAVKKSAEKRRKCRWVSPKEAAEELGVSERTVTRWIADGRFPGKKQPGGKYGRILIPEGDLGL